MQGLTAEKNEEGLQKEVTVDNQGQRGHGVERGESEEIQFLSLLESQFPIRLPCGPKTGDCKAAGK